MHPAIPIIAQGSLVAKDASPCCTVLHISSKLRTEALKIWMFTGHSAIVDYAHFLLTNLLESMAVAEYADNFQWWVMLAEKMWPNFKRLTDGQYGFMGLSGHVKYKHVIQNIIDHIQCSKKPFQCFALFIS